MGKGPEGSPTERVDKKDETRGKLAIKKKCTSADANTSQKKEGKYPRSGGEEE